MRKFAFFQLFGVLIVSATFFVVSILNERLSVERQLTSYVGLWEEETTRALILKKDPELLGKILSQLSLFQSQVYLTEVKILDQGFAVSTDSRFNSFQIPLSLNLLPVGYIRVQLSIYKLLIGALISPVFLGGLFLATLFSIFLWNRELKVQLETAKLNEDVRSKSEIANVARQVAHDIRGPLSALQAVQKKLSLEDPELRGLLQRSCERIQEIAEDLLSQARDWKRKESGSGFTMQESQGVIKKVEHAGTVDFSRLINTLKAEFTSKFPSVAWDFVSKMEARAETSFPETRLTRLLANLLQNSAEAMDSKPGRVHTEFFVRDQLLHIRIQDTGKGLPENLIAGALAGRSLGKENGNGMGLSEAKIAIETVGGRLQFYSQVDVGTLVAIEIPLKV